jgi:Domain of unknown function (DUF4149)
MLSVNAGLNPMSSQLQKIRIALLGLWIGAMAFFSFFVAPAAFAVLPSTQLAGQVVSRTLGGLEIFGMIVGVLLLALVLVSRSQQNRIFPFEMIVIILMTAASAISRFVVSARLHQIRVEFGERLNSLPATDATKATFNLLHQVSVGLTGFMLLAALVLMIMLITTPPREQ